MRPSQRLALVLLLVGAAGCSSTIAKPTLRAPGSVDYQQRVAERYDPYPDPNLGPPVLGGRPQGFESPREPLPLRPADGPTYAPRSYDRSIPAPSPYMPSTMQP